MELYENACVDHQGDGVKQVISDDCSKLVYLMNIISLVRFDDMINKVSKRN